MNTKSKALQAIELYDSMVVAGTISADRKDRNNRAPVIKAFKEVLGLTGNGAATYYGNIQRQLKGWTLETRKVKEPTTIEQPITQVVDHMPEAIEKVNAMTTAQLVELYNVSQATSIKKFRDKATAIKKILEVYGDNLPQVLSA